MISVSQPLPIRVDTDLMKQAVLNVVINGVQAMPEWRHPHPARVRYPQAAVLEVHDTGAGVSPEIRDKIFNLYFTTKKSGSGIGLALTYRAMQLHNGVLDLDSESRPGHNVSLYASASREGSACGETCGCAKRARNPSAIIRNKTHRKRYVRFPNPGSHRAMHLPRGTRSVRCAARCGMPSEARANHASGTRSIH